MRTSLWVALLAGPLAVLGAHAHADEGARSGPVLTETLTAGLYAIEGKFGVPARPHAVWQVLTDYDGMPHFVPSVLTSVAKKRGAGEELVEQEFEGKAFIFTRDMHLQLDVHEQLDRRITFRDVGGADFEVYHGSWRIQKVPGGSKVVYLLWAKPKGFVPAGVAQGAFKDAALKMLTELQAEILRRAGNPLSPQAEAEGRAP